MRVVVPFLLLLIAFTFSCKSSKKPVRPVEKYEEEDRFEPQQSIIKIPIDINIKGLEASLNEQLSGTLYEDNNLKDGDNMKVKAVKDGTIEIGATPTSVSYKVPLDLWIQYDTGFGKVEATAKLSMDFVSDYSIAPNWQLMTNSKLAAHEWKEKPRLKLGVISIPVQSIANLIISRSEQVIGTTIDEKVAESFKLEDYVNDAWKMMFEPIELSPEYQTWLMVKPSDIGMTPVVVENDRIQSTIIVASKPELLFGLAPMPSPLKALPPFAYRYLGDDNKEGFQIYVEATMDYHEAESLTKQSLLGERFEYGKRYVQIEDIELYGQGNKLVIDLKMSGTYTGSIYLTGQPKYNERKNRIEIDDLQYTLDTKNFLFKSAAWIAKSTIKKKLQENMDYFLDYNLRDAKQQMQETLAGYEITEGISLKGNLDDIKLYNAYLTADGFKVAVALNGDVKIDIEKLSK